MSTPSLEYFNTVWQYLPQGHEKPLKQAFYNTVASIFVVIAAVVAVTVYFILAPFIRPLYWAVLCGTFLYPFKRRLTNLLRKWLKGLDTSGTPFAMGLMLLPLQIGDSAAESMTNVLWSNWKVVLGLFFGIPSIYLVYYFTPLHRAFLILIQLLQWLYEFLEIFTWIWVWPLFAGYIFGVLILWKSVPSCQSWLRFMSGPAWVSMLLYLVNIAGPLKVPVFLLMISVMIIGVIVQMNPALTSELSDDEGAKASPSFCTVLGHTLRLSSPSKSNIRKPDESLHTAAALKPVQSTTLDEGPVIQAPSSGTSTSSMDEPKLTFDSSVTKPSTLRIDDSRGTSRPGTAMASKRVSTAQVPTTSMVDQCFMALFWGHIIVRVWMHVWLIVLLFIFPILHWAYRKISQQFAEGGVLHSMANNAKITLLDWLGSRREALLPNCLRGLGCLLLKGDHKIITFLEQGLDQATSILFILMMLVGTFLFTVIGAVQIQRETMYMVTSTQNLMNKTMNSEFSQYLPNAEMMRKTMDQVLQKTHEHGRNFIASKVKDYLPVDQSSKETEIIINQTLEVWDKLYETMLSQEQASNTSKQGLHELTSVNALWNTFSGKNLQITGIVEFVKENLDTFMSVWESVWMVLKSNMNLFFTVVTTILSALLGGGTAILNFVISAIIFLTTLFYLLASSGDMYKPAELFSNMSPGSTGSRFGTAVERAISGVFKASLKMAAFYGLYTWLVHLIFGMDIIFIPSALAACFAAVPFLGPYWAALPAVIELWLVQGNGLGALLLFLAHMAPSYIVDTAIYREIEGGHPYVTGLAIAGGILFMGLEGALIGPIILCCLIVVLNMYSSILQNEPSTPSPVPIPQFSSSESQSQSLFQYRFLPRGPQGPSKTFSSPRLL